MTPLERRRRRLEEQEEQGGQGGLDELVRAGLAAHTAGEAAAARGHLERALAHPAAPDHPGLHQVYYFLGVVCNSMGQLEPARDAYLHAVQLDWNQANAHCNLGRTYELLGEVHTAVHHLKAATAADPTNAPAWCNLSSALKSSGDYPGAIQAASRSAELNVELGEAYINLADALSANGMHGQALGHAERAVELRPGMSGSHKVLGTCLKAMGRLSEATDAFERSLELDPAQPDVRHLLTGLRGGRPERAPDEYTESLFDGYAIRYDAEMVGQLEYKVPSQLAGLVRQLGRRPPGRVLDLGCGTGLSGEQWRGAETLIGVDLSRKMLDHAELKGVYHELRQGEIVAVLGQLRAERRWFDLVVACDVLCYFGELAGVFGSAAGVMGPGGLLGFSVESALGEEQFALQPSGRYAHADEFVLAQAERSGFELVGSEAAVLRAEGKGKILGKLFVFQKDDNQPVLSKG